MQKEKGMALIKCQLCNRYYDDNKSSQCPFCLNVNESFNGQKTLPLDFETPPQYDFAGDESKTQAYDEGIDSDEKTIGVFFAEEDYNPVTGWIVCVKGTVKGKSYELHMNRNFVGRDKLMDISIPDDLQISRKNHLSITYDFKSQSFYAKSENGSLSVNGKSADHPVKLNENDVLSFGKSEYVFVPYCTVERNWDSNHDQ